MIKISRPTDKCKIVTKNSDISIIYLGKSEIPHTFYPSIHFPKGVLPTKKDVNQKEYTCTEYCRSQRS